MKTEKCLNFTVANSPVETVTFLKGLISFFFFFCIADKGVKVMGIKIFIQNYFNKILNMTI